MAGKIKSRDNLLAQLSPSCEILAFNHENKSAYGAKEHIAPEIESKNSAIWV